MVVLLWVMNMNCTARTSRRTMSQKRPTLCSSSGASTSSSRQNGAGFRSKIENTSATAVSAFSPPDSCWMELLRLPGGRAMIGDAGLEHVLADELQIGMPAAEEARELSPSGPR